MSEFDNLIERGMRALARPNAADKEFNATWRKMDYGTRPVQRKPVKPRAKRRK